MRTMKEKGRNDIKCKKRGYMQTNRKKGRKEKRKEGKKEGRN